MRQLGKQVIGILLCLVMVVGMIPTMSIQAASVVKMSKKSVSLHVGENTTLRVTGTSKKVTWTSSNKKVATVTAKGKVTGKKEGTATITAKVSKKKYTCKVKVKTLNPEAKRAVTLGLIDKNYLTQASKTATTQELEDVFTTIMKKRGASASKIKAWNKVALGSKTPANIFDACLAVYYVAGYLAEGGIPRVNAFGGEYRTPSNDELNEAVSTLIMWDENHRKWYNMDDVFEGQNGLVDLAGNYWASMQFSSCMASRYSGNYVIPADEKTAHIDLTHKLSRWELALIATRYYDSFEPEAKFVSIDTIGKTVITEKEIASAKTVPEVDKNGCSDEWIGSYVQNYCYIGANKLLATPGDGLTYNYRESEFKAAKELGINYIRCQFEMDALAYPNFDTDRTKVNETIVKDLDNTVRWGLKYGIHISFCFQGIPDDDLDGLGAMFPDGTKENNVTPDYQASKESYELKARYLAAFAKRYENVPSKYLSFELQNENSPNFVEEIYRTFSSEEMADQFIMLANAIWQVDPKRSVSISTDFSPLEKYYYDDTKKAVDYWKKLANAGINLEYHLYEPRSFCVSDVDLAPKQRSWPYTDPDGNTWDMEKIYQTYVAPFKQIADEAGVGFRLGECGLFGGSFTNKYNHSSVVAWANDFSTTMQKHKVSYVLGILGNNPIQPYLTDFIIDDDNDYTTMTIGTKYTKKVYHLEKYDAIFYHDMELVKAAFGKK